MKLDLASCLDVPELPAKLSAVEKRMAEATATNSSLIAEPLTRLLQVRGKRLRPALIFATAQKIDGRIIAAATAVELLHLATLIHDDIIDSADTRWNIPTISKKEGSDNAIVVGDFVIACALREAANVSGDVCQALAAAFAKICEGQAYELADTGDLARTKESYELGIRGKTAALFGASCRIGGLCSGASDTEVEALARFGEHFGIMFQLLDDVLDFASTPELLGKPTGNDVREGTYTLPLILAVQQDDKLATLVQNNQQAGVAAALLEAGTLKQTIDLAREHAQVAAQNAPSKLAHFPKKYLDWSLKNFVDPKYQSLLHYSHHSSATLVTENNLRHTV